MTEPEMIRALLKELSEAIHKCLTSSTQVAETVARIQETGNDAFVIVRATVALGRSVEAEEEGSIERTESSPLDENGEPRFSGHDLEFFRELHINLP